MRPRARQAADVDLAGDGGGDQGGPAFLEEVDGALIGDSPAIICRMRSVTPFSSASISPSGRGGLNT
jgi:hypothetical protein